MATSWTISGANFKSPLRVVAGFLWRSREAKATKCREQKRELEEAQRVQARLEAELQREREEKRGLQAENRRLQGELARQTREVRLPDDPPLKGQPFGPRLITLAINLGRRLGLRPAQGAMEIVFDWLGVKQRIPKWSTIRMWMLRAGLAAMREPAEPTDGLVWLTDHSNQVGAEKVLAVLGVRVSRMPKPGETLKHEDVRLLTVQPGTEWKREDMARVYRELARQFGLPRAVLCDGAVELRDGVLAMEKDGDSPCQISQAASGAGLGQEKGGQEYGRVEKNDSITTRKCPAVPDAPPVPARTIVLHDFKHKAANLLESLIGKHPRFAEFHAQVGKTRAAVQQTELAYLRPPGKKPKARFMNLGPTLRWAAKHLWLLEHPEARSRQWVTPARVEEKLGWLRSYAAEIGEWDECQQVVNRGLTFINAQGLYHGAGEGLRAAIGGDLQHASAQQLRDRLVEFVSESEGLLKEGERLPMSTEILESTFALYKQLERQHSKGGFTSLLAAFGALLKPATPADVRRAFAAVKVRDVHEWVDQNLGHTLNSKRLAVQEEYRRATKTLLTT